MSTVLHLPANKKTIKSKNLLIEIKIVLPPIIHFHNKRVETYKKPLGIKKFKFWRKQPSKNSTNIIG